MTSRVLLVRQMDCEVVPIALQLSNDVVGLAAHLSLLVGNPSWPGCKNSIDEPPSCSLAGCRPDERIRDAQFLDEPVQ